MFGWMKRICREIRDRIRYSAKISPESIRKLASELQELAVIVERVNPELPERGARIWRIRTEVGQLIDLTGRMEFHRLSVQRRLELHQSLEQSRAQLLESMRSAPTPTDRVQ
ncbi:hypothetical protein DSM19430T_18570 [Desulfovibrio psychrotolerans]|uniref:Uncharacterized protein n=2 Tax=Desulfovibrio psychrotolerans TaxID=415242 RepID=A0A7J0BTY6_9BACT|nr:hypothetical protein DSM19430T_18570 [Desulfovibrio psychrotolerans]